MIPIILLIGLNCYANPNKTDWKKLNIKGKVKSISEISYLAIDKFGKIKKGNRAPNPLWEKTDYIFDTNGYLLELIQSDSSKSYYYSESYKYDIWENLIETSISGGSKYYYKYDNKGNKIELNTYLPNGQHESKHIYKYDEKDNMIEETLYYQESQPENTLYKYDEKNNLIAINHYRSNGNCYSEVSYKYEDNNKIKAIWDNSYYSIYQYDDKGNLIVENSLNSDDKPLYGKTTYEYEYDRNGNWIKSIVFKNGFAEYILERKIEYL